MTVVNPELVIFPDAVAPPSSELTGVDVLPGKPAVRGLRGSSGRFHYSCFCAPQSAWSTTSHILGGVCVLGLCVSLNHSTADSGHRPQLTTLCLHSIQARSGTVETRFIFVTERNKVGGRRKHSDCSFLTISF